MSHHNYGVSNEHYCGGTPDDDRHDSVEAENARLKEQLKEAEADRDKAFALLRDVYAQAGNGAAPSRRHALTPGLRDSIKDVLWDRGFFDWKNEMCRCGHTKKLHDASVHIDSWHGAEFVGCECSADGCNCLDFVGVNRWMTS